MQLAFITARQVLILFLMIVAGFVCGKTGAIKPDGKKTLSDLLLYLVMPAMILDSYLIEFDAETFGNLLVAFGLSAALMLGGLAVAVLLTLRSKSADRTMVRFACMFSNAGYMGIPLVRAVYGETAVLYASAFLTVFNILVWTVGYVMVSGQTQPKAVLRSILTCSSIIAVAVGLAVYLGRIPVPDILTGTVELVGGMNTPLSMIITGLTMAGHDLRALLKKRELPVVMVLRLVVIPLISLAVLRLLGVRGLVADVCLLLEACPTAAVTTVFAVRFAKSEDLAAGAVVFTTLASMIWLPVYALLISAV